MSAIKSIVPFKAATQRHINTVNNRHTTPVNKKMAEKAFLRNLDILDKHYDNKTAEMIRKRTVGK
tara:strand:+ start:171 stop:365 length:195 start_codon:yes stop_codon:yes gene_type:complete